jgi:hypothetical protein
MMSDAMRWVHDLLAGDRSTAAMAFDLCLCCAVALVVVWRAPRRTQPSIAAHWFSPERLHGRDERISERPERPTQSWIAGGR